MGQKLDFSKISIIAGLVLVVVGGVMLIGNLGLFQGNLLGPRGLPQAKLGRTLLPPGNWFKDRSVPPKIVSPVASAVPSVVVSKVTSSGGVSNVASVVVSSVASAVAIPSAPTGLVVESLRPMTAEVLKGEARSFYLRYPAKFKLTPEKAKGLIDLYKARNPRLFPTQPR